ncbi:hypothetical protein [Halorubrum sp. SD626R]|uniref:DUF7847 domain-containing protein n=1 Tax=Halorubrum sp. SD626R TaxID=1419722 RepID=UPI000AA0C789|nr:hypothetical protein [Halorubrum sp. SD626R]TKX82312.1 hypothetical protein EXE53_01570 [Halorubrum sp. SD626R]
MAALRALRPAVGGIARNPVLLLVTALYGLAQVPNLLVPATRPILAAIVSLATFGVLVLALPFVQGGLLGMASEAIAGRTGLGTLVAEGRDNYLSLLLAYFVLLAINLVFGIVAFVGGLIVFVTGVATVPTDAPAVGVNPTLLAVLAIVGGGLLLAYFLVTFAVQFYAHAVVLDDAALVDGFRRSVGLVRSNVLSVVGYSVILLVGSVALGTLAAAASLVLGSQTAGAPAAPFADLASVEPTLSVLAVAGVGYLVLTSAFAAFYATYSVAFYEAISRNTAPV